MKVVSAALIRFVSGEYSLPKAFWGFYMGGIVVLGVAMLLLMEVAIRSGAGVISNKVSVWLFVFMAPVNCYVVVGAIGVWRSASGYMGPKVWAWLAKLQVVGGVLGIIYDVIHDLFSN